MCRSSPPATEATRETLLDAYARFLAFLSSHDASLLARPPAARIDRNIIESYVGWQPRSCGKATIVANLFSLRSVLRHIAPEHDWAWISTIAKRIDAQAKLRPAKNHLVMSETLYQLGIELMNRAITNANAVEKISIKTALDYRDGLMIALLALIPLRRRSLAALRIGKQLVRSGNLWELDIPAEDIKTKRPLAYPISAELSGRIDLYLNQFRCRMSGAAGHDYLWASREGHRMRDKTIGRTIRQRTRKALGFPVSPHRFRLAAATLWSTRDPVNVRGAKDLLGHATFATTEKHYIMAQSRVAGHALARAIEGQRKGRAVPVR